MSNLQLSRQLDFYEQNPNAMIIYEDQHVLAIREKPNGMVIHPDQYYGIEFIKNAIYANGHSSDAKFARRPSTDK
jgi:23S rRNA-/tRNA-specific pseudouridylate synthase